MLVDPNDHRITEGKVAVSPELPNRLIARVDLAVAHRQFADDWATRVDIVEECLERFFAAGG